jgi:hypothetical protein
METAGQGWQKERMGEGTDKIKVLPAIAGLTGMRYQTRFFSTEIESQLTFFFFFFFLTWAGLNCDQITNTIRAGGVA